MQLTALGRYGLYPPKGGACSSYFVETNSGETLLLDCGPGALAKMENKQIAALGTLILTHLHWDHMSDALPLLYALERLDTMLDLFLPAQPAPVAEMLAASNRISPHWIEPNMQIQRNGYVLSFVRMRHPVPAYGVRVRADGKLLAYTGDTNTCENLSILLADEPDIALADACFSDEQWDEHKPHLSARLAAAAMYDARVKLPLLAHLPPDGNEEKLLSQACEANPRAEWIQEGRIYGAHD